MRDKASQRKCKPYERNYDEQMPKRQEHIKKAPSQRRMFKMSFDKTS